jgi:hypothetical protein
MNERELSGKDECCEDGSDWEEGVDREGESKELP